MTKVRQLTLRNENPEPTHKLMIGIPFTGQVRFEWHLAMTGLITPTNWAHSLACPYSYEVGIARNLVVQKALEQSYDWILFIDHDVIMPPDILIRMRAYMTDGTKPIVSGLYYTKASTPEPLIYRGRGTGPYYDWSIGDKVWADATGMGCTLIHTSLFKNMSPPWFVTPRDYTLDAHGFSKISGTEDIFWYDRVIEEDVVRKAGFDVPDPKLPVYVDTSLFCEHIDVSGTQYPSSTNGAHLINHAAARKALGRHRKRVKQSA